MDSFILTAKEGLYSSKFIQMALPDIEINIDIYAFNDIEKSSSIQRNSTQKLWKKSRSSEDEYTEIRAQKIKKYSYETKIFIIILNDK